MYKISLSNKYTCIDIEQELGLEHGAVKEVTEHSNGTFDVCFDKEPTSDQKAALQSLLNSKITKEKTE